MSAQPSEKVEVKEEGQEEENLGSTSYFSFLRLLTPKEIENYTKRKIKQKVSALKAVSGEDVTGYEFRTYFEEVKTKQVENEEAEEDNKSKAKILPFAKKKRNLEEIERNRIQKEKEEKEKQKKLILDEIDQLKIDEEKQVQKRGIVSSDLIKKKNLLQKKLVKLDEVSETDFLLKQRRKLEESNNILKGQYAYDSYQKCSEVESNKTTKDIHEDAEEKSVGTTGVLLNKRQY